MGNIKKPLKKTVDLSDDFVYFLRVLNKNLLHGMKREFRFHDSRKWRFDCAWPSQKVAVECDGIVYKACGGRHNTDTDREKINTAVSMGWRVLRFSGQQIKQTPSDCVRLLVDTIDL